jgi:hypothetical protein
LNPDWQKKSAWGGPIGILEQSSSSLYQRLKSVGNNKKLSE